MASEVEVPDRHGMSRPRRAAEVIPGLGKRLRSLRRMRRHTQEALAERADTDAVTISRIERGVTTPDLETLARISEALEVPVTALFPETTDPGGPDSELTGIWQ